MSEYNEEYFERGLVAGVSGYMNYSWMPELTLRMAHYFIMNLPIKAGETVLDYGCAKGYIVKALRLLGVEACGVDISKYAVSKADENTKNFCTVISGVEDEYIGGHEYDWIIAKDVLEHLNHNDLSILLKQFCRATQKLFVVVPLAEDDKIGRYIIPAYDNDVTHILAKSKDWWKSEFESSGWVVDRFDYEFQGCKENWTKEFPKGNGFFILSRLQK